MKVLTEGLFSKFTITSSLPNSPSMPQSNIFYNINNPLRGGGLEGLRHLLGFSFLVNNHFLSSFIKKIKRWFSVGLYFIPSSISNSLNKGDVSFTRSTI